LSKVIDSITRRVLVAVAVDADDHIWTTLPVADDDDDDDDDRRASGRRMAVDAPLSWHDDDSGEEEDG
jgi:hypothetical protein